MTLCQRSHHAHLLHLTIGNRLKARHYHCRLKIPLLAPHQPFQGHQRHIKSARPCQMPSQKHTVRLQFMTLHRLPHDAHLSPQTTENRLKATRW